MDYDSSTKFISSLAKFLQSLCNGYVEFDSGVQVIGHLYLSVDTGKTIDYILNEKVCKTDENSVTFISNSFHAQPAERPKAQGKKIIEKDSKPEDANDNQTSLPEPKSTNFGTLPTRGAQNSPHSQNFKRAFSPSSKRTKDGSSPSKLGRLSPKHKKNRTESLDQNVSSQISNPASENSISSQPSPTTDGITAPISAQSTEAVHGSQYTDSYQQNFFQTGEDDNSMVDESEERDIKPSIDTDVTFIKEEFAPSSCSQSSNQNRDRTHGEDSSAYYHSNQTFPASFAGQTGFGGTVRTNFNSSSERSSLYPGSSQLEAENSGDPSAFKLQCHVSSAANVSVDEVYDLLGHYGQATCLWCSHKCNHQELFRKHVRIHHEGVQPIICTNCWHVCADYDSFVTHCSHKESKGKNSKQKEKTRKTAKKSKSAPVGIPFECRKCKKHFRQSCSLFRHRWKCEGTRSIVCSMCDSVFYRSDHFKRHMITAHSFKSPHKL
ncbi:zinc finger protein 62 homolog isoform X5 [Biomphalaria glabrata]|uniref:Zinc finger protein 62 homolog isoform X5 n=1 Tax=Biomphalaria glabrata TaxID=6526 RepID=A0A9W3B7E0_BIOGL|nr:zinc finger protein 62 homolog isoform X5 [Biomphalaria glabrata]